MFTSFQETSIVLSLQNLNHQLKRGHLPRSLAFSKRWVQYKTDWHCHLPSPTHGTHFVHWEKDLWCQ